MSGHWSGTVQVRERKSMKLLANLRYLRGDMAFYEIRNSIVITVCRFFLFVGTIERVFIVQLSSMK